MSDRASEPDDWLRRFAPEGWIRAALHELAQAEKAWESGQVGAGTVVAKRAAGMALNAALAVEPDATWGRSYVQHLVGLRADSRVPEAVRSACRAVLDAKAPSGAIVALRVPADRGRLMEAARDVIAHAWVVVKRHEPKGD